ncbi:MAG: hypothetical protein ACI8P9_002465 [Parasphingorhabdus sp.]|jgi:hypothetical protein
MTELKTQPTNESVLSFLNGVKPAEKHQDVLVLHQLLSEITDQPGVMWGGSIVGYGKYRYRYASGHSGEFFLTDFSPRKQNQLS